MNQSPTNPDNPPRLAVLSDLHGNLSALTAVIERLKQIKPQAVVVLGDLVGYLCRPNQVVRTVRDAGWPCLQGNYDLAVLTGGSAGVDKYLKPGIGPEPRAVFDWSDKRTNQASRDYLGSLPGAIRMSAGGLSLLACHGSPTHVRQYIYPDHPQDQLDRLVEDSGVQVVLMGHTHRPMVRHAGGGLAVNPGSVGKPKDGDPRASLALLELGEKPRAEILRVPYDLETEARLLTENGMPPATIQRLYAGT